MKPINEYTKKEIVELLEANRDIITDPDNYTKEELYKQLKRYEK